MTLLSPVLKWKREKQYESARALVEDTLSNAGPISFDPVPAQNEKISAWADMEFGRPMSSACARTLYQLDSLLSRTDVEILFHGGMINRKTGLFERPRPFRYVFAVCAAIYVLLALAGSAVFSLLIWATPIHLGLRCLFLTLTVTALVGHSVHGFLVLVRPLFVFRRLERSQLAVAASES